MAPVANKTLFMKLENGDDLSRNFGERYILTTTTQRKTTKTKKKRNNPEEVGACYDITREMTVLDNTDPMR